MSGVGFTDRGIDFNGNGGDPVMPLPGSIKLKLVEATAPGISVDFEAEEVLAPEGAYIFNSSGPVTLGFEVEDERLISISRIKLIAHPDKGYTIPKSVRISIDNSTGTRRRLRQFASGDMSVEGIFDSGLTGGQRARRIYVTVFSSWGRGPVRIDQISVQ